MMFLVFASFPHKSINLPLFTLYIVTRASYRSRKFVQKSVYKLVCYFLCYDLNKRIFNHY